MSTWQQWVHDNDEFITSISTWQLWVHGNDKYMTTMSTWQRLVHDNDEYMATMSTWQRWVHDNDEYIIIIIIKKDWQCKADRGRLTPYQSEDPCLTLPANRGKEDKGKIVKHKKVESN